MKALTAYINQKNGWGSIFGGYQYEIKTVYGRKRVAQALDSDLSPENLTCDGELSHTQVQTKLKLFSAAAAELKKMDPSVQLYDFS